MLTNPIIRRELISVLRTRRATAILFSVIAALTALVLLRWPVDAQVNLSGQQAQQVLRVFAYGMLVVCVLLVPAFPATSIVKERRSGTLALLLRSPMSPMSILFGKLVGVTGFVLLLIAMSLPAAAATLVMGGIDPVRQIGGIYVVLILLALQYATLGLAVSSYASSSDSALRLTYGLVLALAVLTLIPSYFVTGLDELNVTSSFAAFSIPLDGPVGVVLDWIRNLSPVPALMHALGQESLGSRGLAGEAASPIYRYALLAMITIALCCLYVLSKLSGFMLDKPRSQGRVTDERSAGARVFRRVMFLWFFDPQRRTGSIRLANPVMVKEFRCRAMGRGHWMMRLIAGCLVASLGLAFASTLTWQAQLQQEESVATLGAIMVILQMALIVLITPSLAAGLISAERESGGWALLQQTPMSTFTIVSGKLMSAGWTVILILLATLPGYAMMILIKPETLDQVLHVIYVLTLMALLAVMLSAAISSLLKSTAAATATAYGLLVALCVGPILIWLAENAPFSRTLVEAVLPWSPLAAGLAMIEAPGFESYDLWPISGYVNAGLSAASLLVLLVQTWRLSRPS